MKVTLGDGSTLECDDQPFAEGASGFLHWDKAGKYVVKLYKQGDGQKEAALQKIIGPEYNVVHEQPYWDTFFTWPKAIVKQPRLGLIMLRAPKGTDKLHWFLSEKPRNAYAVKHGAQSLGKWSDNLEIAIQMARVVRVMHLRGLCHSDLSFNNFLVAPAQRRMVLIDCDGLVVPGFLPPDVLGTPRCMAPELEARLTSPTSAKIEPSLYTDLHALATLIYWLLLLRHPLLGPKVHSLDPGIDEALALGEKALFVENSQDRSNNLREMYLPPYTTLFTPALQEIVRRAFVDGLRQPQLRPTAAEWERALERMRDTLVPCDNAKCSLDRFVFHSSRPLRCPRCGQASSGAETLPLLNFYRPRGGMKGHYQGEQGYMMVGQPNRTLHLWHVTGGVAGDPKVDPKPKAELRLHKDKWHLKNLDLPELSLLERTRGHQAVAVGQEVELSSGTCLLLGPPDQGRVAYVELVRVK